MFLKAGILSLALLLASRILGVLRETAQAAAFGTSGMADVAVLLVTLPDWIASVAASGALAYVLLPAWAGRPPADIDRLQRRVAFAACAIAAATAVLLVLAREPAIRTLAGGLSPGLQGLAAAGLAWSAIALPLSFLAALWVTRLQHERDFLGMYAANLVVNIVLIGSILVAATRPREAVPLLGMGLLAAMLARLAWLRLRLPARVPASHEPLSLPAPPVWLWAMLSAGLPLALPFTARSLASHAGEGALATFNYAWKLVELPAILAIQLVASLAFPRVTQALAGNGDGAAVTIRGAFALAWTLACAAAAGLLLGGPALAQLLFGWGRMRAGALPDVAHWGMAGAWGLLPQAISAVALTVLAARSRMHPAVGGYAAGLLLLLVAGLVAAPGGFALMTLLNVAYLLAALACLWALGPQRARWVPWPAFGWPLALLAVIALAAVPSRQATGGSIVAGLVAGAAGALLVLGVSLWRGSEVRAALRR